MAGSGSAAPKLAEEVICEVVHTHFGFGCGGGGGAGKNPSAKVDGGGRAGGLSTSNEYESFYSVLVSGRRFNHTPYISMCALRKVRISRVRKPREPSGPSEPKPSRRLLAERRGRLEPPSYMWGCFRMTFKRKRGTDTHSWQITCPLHDYSCKTKCTRTRGGNADPTKDWLVQVRLHVWAVRGLMHRTRIVDSLS